MSTETANDPASSANAVPEPVTPTSTPPSAGPTRRIAIGRTNWSSAFACGRSSTGTSSGTADSKAGVKKPAPSA